MEVLGVELMKFGMHFDNFGSLRDPVPGLLVSLVIYVELGQKGLDITLVIDDQKDRLEVLSEGKILVAFSLYWWLSASSTD